MGTDECTQGRHRDGEQLSARVAPVASPVASLVASRWTTPPASQLLAESGLFSTLRPSSLPEGPGHIESAFRVTEHRVQRGGATFVRINHADTSSHQPVVSALGHVDRWLPAGPPT